jgi:hypothetical protein
MAFGWKKQVMQKVQRLYQATKVRGAKLCRYTYKRRLEPQGRDACTLNCTAVLSWWGVVVAAVVGSNWVVIG